MKKKCSILITLLLASSILGMDGVDLLKKYYFIDSAVVSLTDLTLKLKEKSFFVASDGLSNPWRSATEYTGTDVALVLFPDKVEPRRANGH